MTEVVAPPLVSNNPLRVAKVAPMAVAGALVTWGNVTGGVVKLRAGVVQATPTVLDPCTVKK